MLWRESSNHTQNYPTHTDHTYIISLIKQSQRITNKLQVQGYEDDNFNILAFIMSTISSVLTLQSPEVDT